jgi:hypothetical protein
MSYNLQEFDRQVQNLLAKGYPQLFNKSPEKFQEKLEKLKTFVPEVGEPAIEEGKLPFVIVVKSINGEAETLMDLVDRDGKKGFSKMYPHEAKVFIPIDNVILPDDFAYLLLDIDRGKDTLNVRPDEAFKIIKARNRSPLTIDEGIALITQYPEFLIRNNCYSLLASRCPGNKRVPAIWINASKRPNLGWCWDGNPHTWLGSASCSERIDTD